MYQHHTRRVVGSPAGFRTRTRARPSTTQAAMVSTMFHAKPLVAFLAVLAVAVQSSPFDMTSRTLATRPAVANSVRGAHKVRAHNMG